MRYGTGRGSDWVISKRFTRLLPQAVPYQFGQPAHNLDLLGQALD